MLRTRLGYAGVGWREDEDGITWRYTQYGSGDAFALESIDVPLTMDEIYRKVNFDEPLLEEVE